ncbi:MAG: M23 family metallopeptidase [Vallitaleaceae bacterium]|nr:M23 family metallopeptidase [Vallitaleaceae bacterium]
MFTYDFKVPSLNGSYKKLSKVPSDPTIESLYHKIFDDLACFPVMADGSNIENGYTYTNSFLAERTYGGNRKHMGIDLMDSNNEKGALNIVSMTDGVIENMGWLELGGYRIGIRTPTGAYFYYAHLNNYAAGLKEGSQVFAGQLLGTMGSSGYGPEGTIDQFDVHLHLGIALDLDGKEFWVNPYAILMALDPQQPPKSLPTEVQ